MSKPSGKPTARDFTWEHRLRQRIALERIISTFGTPEEKLQSKKFLEAMEQANPDLLEDVEQYILDFFENSDDDTPELFDEREYLKIKGHKPVFPLPKEKLWEDKIIRRAVVDYQNLFHPCDNSFHNAVMGLQYLNTIHPELFARARIKAVEQKARILTVEISCDCNCTSKRDRQPAGAFITTDTGRFKNVSQRIRDAKQRIESGRDQSHIEWQFFLDRISEIAPEMLE